MRWRCDMGRRIIVVASLAGSLVGIGAAPALADEVTPSPAFGQHVSDMAPEHALEDGAAFGACVSAMAQGGDCPHA